MSAASCSSWIWLFDIMRCLSSSNSFILSIITTPTILPLKYAKPTRFLFISISVAANIGRAQPLQKFIMSAAPAVVKWLSALQLAARFITPVLSAALPMKLVSWLRSARAGAGSIAAAALKLQGTLSIWQSSGFAREVSVKSDFSGRTLTIRAEEWNVKKL